MLKRKPSVQWELFVPDPLEQLVSDDHVLVRVDRVLDPGWLHDEDADCHCAHSGRPGIELKTAVRPVLAGFLHGTVHDRRLMHEARADLATRSHPDPKRENTNASPGLKPRAACRETELDMSNQNCRILGTQQSRRRAPVFPFPARTSRRFDQGQGMRARRIRSGEGGTIIPYPSTARLAGAR